MRGRPQVRTLVRMTNDAPLQPMPDPDPAFTPGADADLAADPTTSRGPDGSDLGTDGAPAGDADANAPQVGGPGLGSPEKDPEDWVTGDEPATGPQRSYLATLAREAGEEVPDDLTKAQASETIDRLQSRTGRGA